MIIAIDGPAGAGKSTIARLLARRLNLIHLDSGALYRSLCYLALEQNLSPKLTIAYLTQNPDSLKITYQNNQQQIILNNQQIHSKLKKDKITSNTKKFADEPTCRTWVNNLIKKTATSDSLITDGRDIGTMVFPNADFKFYLDASINQRAKRRALELKIDLTGIEFEELKKKIATRDEQDKTRIIAPLKKAKNSFYLDSSSMSQVEVIEYFYNIITQKTTCV